MTPTITILLILAVVVPLDLSLHRRLNRIEGKLDAILKQQSGK